MIKKYLPVQVQVDEDEWNKLSDEECVDCFTPWCWHDYFKKKVLVDSPLYSADELLEVLRKVGDMPCGETKKLYGEEYYGELYDKYSASEIIEKYRAYESEPKVGQIWKNKGGGGICIVTRCEENPKEVYLVFRDGSCGKRGVESFFGTFQQT